MYENHDSHCSCNGLEIWDPEETSIAAILIRPRDDWPGLFDAMVALVKEDEERGGRATKKKRMRAGEVLDGKAVRAISFGKLTKY